MVTYFDAIDALVPQAELVLIGDQYIGIDWKDSRPKPSESEINTKLIELQNAEPMRVLREERNRKLALTDWRASSDLTLSSQWVTYRQALRDLPSTASPTLDENGNLQNVTWPEEPT